MSAAASKRVAVVTAGKIAVVRGLCKQFQGDVIIGARHNENGKDMLKKLNAEGLKASIYELDNTDDASLHRLHNFLQKNYGGLDVLMNNAAQAFQIAPFLSFSEQAREIMAKCFWATSNSCKVLFPLLRPHARVVNILDGNGSSLEWKCSQELQNRFLDPELSLVKIEQLMKEFVESSKAGNHKEKGWPDHAYGVTKIGVTLMAAVQQRELNADSRPDIVVNSCCLGIPGLKATTTRNNDDNQNNSKNTKTSDKENNQNNSNNTKTSDKDNNENNSKDTKTSDKENNENNSKNARPSDQIADTALYLALLPPNTASPKGKYLNSDRKIEKIF